MRRATFEEHADESRVWTEIHYAFRWTRSSFIHRGDAPLAAFVQAQQVMAMTIGQLTGGKASGYRQRQNREPVRVFRRGAYL